MRWRNGPGRFRRRSPSAGGSSGPLASGRPVRRPPHPPGGRGPGAGQVGSVRPRPRWVYKSRLDKIRAEQGWSASPGLLAPEVAPPDAVPEVGPIAGLVLLLLRREVALLRRGRCGASRSCPGRRVSAGVVRAPALGTGHLGSHRCLVNVR